MEKKNKLLIVDDDTTTLLEIISILNKDYMICTAKSGKTALEILDRSQPDLILLDIIMPDLSGFDVMTILKQSRAAATPRPDACGS